MIKAADGCGNTLNHAVVMVGYTDSGSDGGDDNNDDDTDPDPTPVDGCKVTKWWHTCEGNNAGRRLQDTAGHDKYWKIQNSWGTGWGDAGFVRVAIEAGDGVCGVNSVVEWVEYEKY